MTDGRCASPALGRADRDLSRRPAGRGRRGGRRAALVHGRRSGRARRLRDRRGVDLRARPGAHPVAEPAPGRKLRVRRAAPSAAAHRARALERDPRARPLGRLARRRARDPPRRDGARRPPPARLSVHALASASSTPSPTTGLSVHDDGDESRLGRVPVRVRTAPVPDARDRLGRHARAAGAGTARGDLRRARPPDRLRAGRRDRVRLPGERGRSARRSSTTPSPTSSETTTAAPACGSATPTSGAARNALGGRVATAT